MMNDEELIKALNEVYDKEPEQMIKFLESKGIKISANWRETLEAIRLQAFTVAHVKNADLLQYIKESLEMNLREGLSYRDFVKEVAPKVPEKINWVTVYRTNMSSAYNAGRIDAQEELKERMPYWRHVSIIDSRTRPLGKWLDGKVFPANDPHWNTYYPPNEYNDRGVVVAMNEFMLKRALKNGKAQLAKDLPKAKSGESLLPDKAFRGKPNQAYKPDTSKYDNELKKKLESTLKRG